MEKKEEKKGFWASLFSPKPSCSCSCGSTVIEEVKQEAQPVTDEKQDEKTAIKTIPIPVDAINDPLVCERIIRLVDRSLGKEVDSYSTDTEVNTIEDEAGYRLRPLIFMFII